MRSEPSAVSSSVVSGDCLVSCIKGKLLDQVVTPRVPGIKLQFRDHLTKHLNLGAMAMKVIVAAALVLYHGTIQITGAKIFYSYATVSHERPETAHLVSPTRLSGITVDTSRVRHSPVNFLITTNDAQTSEYNIPDDKYNSGHYTDSPAKYTFFYKVQDVNSDISFGRQEYREGNVVRGKYVTLLPDGRKQIVDYIADDLGYRPTIRYEYIYDLGQ